MGSVSCFVISVKSCDMIVGFMVAIFIFPFSSKMFILQGMHNDAKRFLLRMVFACFAEQISMILRG